MYFCAFVVVLHHQLYSLIFNYFLNERNLESTMNVKDYVVQELESYPRTLRQIAVLRYELEHPVQVSTEEMLDAMAFARGEHFGVAPGHVSDKTLYIAMNYRQKANEVNAEISGEISAKLLELEHKKNRIEYYVGMLDSRKAEIGISISVVFKNIIDQRLRICVWCNRIDLNILPYTIEVLNGRISRYFHCKSTDGACSRNHQGDTGTNDFFHVR